MRVAIFDDIHHAYEGTIGVRRLRERAEVQIFTEPFREPSAIANFDALIANRERTRFSRAFLEQLPNLRIIAQTGNHVYHIDLEATEERGIIVAEATGGGCTSAAELAIGLMIAVMRQIPAVDTQVKRGGWPTPMTRVLRGKTLGIVGLGYVGRHVSKIANAFEMKVLAWGPQLTAQAAASVGAESCELDALMARSDIVSIHATLSPDSRGLIDARRLGLMESFRLPHQHGTRSDHRRGRGRGPGRGNTKFSAFEIQPKRKIARTAQIACVQRDRATAFARARADELTE